MPRYTYVCPSCEKIFDIEKGMHSPHPGRCPACGYQGQLMRRFPQLAIKFKGSGFYSTDKALDSFIPGYDGPDEVELMNMGEDVPEGQ